MKFTLEDLANFHIFHVVDEETSNIRGESELLLELNEKLEHTRIKLRTLESQVSYLDARLRDARWRLKND